MYKWHKRFAQGRDSLEDNEHVSWPRMVGIELKIQEAATFVHASLFQTVNEVAGAAAAAKISHGACHRILSDYLNMSCVSID
jgi:hypothetical protein